MVFYHSFVTITCLSVFAIDNVSDQEIIDTRGYDLRRRRRSLVDDNDITLTKTPSAAESLHDHKTHNLTANSGPINDRSHNPLRSNATDENAKNGLGGSRPVANDNDVNVEQPEGSEWRRARHRRLMKFDKRNAMQRRKHSPKVPDNIYNGNYRGDSEVHVERFALDELMDRFRRVIGQWTKRGTEDTASRRGGSIVDESYESTGNSWLKVQMATWGAYIVLPAMIIFYICNLYCCCKFFYFGGWAWPIKKVGRGIFKKYVAGVRTTSTGKMVFEGLTDEEIKANSHMKVVTEAISGVAKQVKAVSKYAKGKPEIDINKLMN